MTELSAPGFPSDAIRARARNGQRCAFPPVDQYGSGLFGATPVTNADPLDNLRLVPPIFTPGRLAKLIETGREPLHTDVDLGSRIGGFLSTFPVYVSAFGSTGVVGDGLGLDVVRQAAGIGIPVVIGENVAPVAGYGRVRRDGGPAMLLDRILAYSKELPAGVGGVVVQQSTEDADAEVWNQVYCDPAVAPLLDSGRLGFELKLGQGAKPGLGGMTIVDTATADSISDQYAIQPIFGPDAEFALRCATPGTFTEEIFGNQIRFMRNNFPRCRIWVKLPPTRDVAVAASIARHAGADAVTVDGAEGGTGWAPLAFLDQVGLPLGECLRRVDWPPGADTTLLASGRIWEGTRAAKVLALGADAVGLGRAALLAAHESPGDGLVNLVECLAFELSMIVSALGKYAVSDIDRDDVWSHL
jgi:hypothetical protein